MIGRSLRGVRQRELHARGHHPRAGARRRAHPAGRRVGCSRPGTQATRRRGGHGHGARAAPHPDEDVRAIIEQAVLPRLAQEPISSLAGGLLDQVVRDEAHVGLVDLALDEIRAGSSTTRTSSSRSSPSGRRLGARRDQRPRRPQDPRRGAQVAGRHPQRPPSRRAARARQAAHRPRRRPPARPRHPGQGRAAQGARARAPAGGRHGDVAVGLVPRRRHRRARGRGRAGPRSCRPRGDGARRAAARRRTPCASASTPASATRRSMPSTATAPS